jgi:hypothetical protein
VQAENRGVWFLPLLPRLSSNSYEVAKFSPNAFHEDRGRISGWINASSSDANSKEWREKECWYQLPDTWSKID